MVPWSGLIIADPSDMKSGKKELRMSEKEGLKERPGEGGRKDRSQLEGVS